MLTLPTSINSKHSLPSTD